MKSISLVFFVFVAFVGLQFSVAQQVDVHNRVEHTAEELCIDDMNSITVPMKKITKKKEKGSSISIEDLQRIVSKRKSARYRKVRKESEKCFKDVEQGSCDDDKDLKLTEKKED